MVLPRTAWTRVQWRVQFQAESSPHIRHLAWFSNRHYILRCPSHSAHIPDLNQTMKALLKHRGNVGSFKDFYSYNNLLLIILGEMT
jgi:hypothetical protein